MAAAPWPIDLGEEILVTEEGEELHLGALRVAGGTPRRNEVSTPNTSTHPWSYR